MTETIQTIIIVVVQLIVGYILSKQIKSQKEIISNYKGLVEATNPEKIVTLFDKRMELQEKLHSADRELIDNQIFELSNFAVHMIAIWKREAEDMNNPEFFNEDSFINKNMPHCSGIIRDMQQIRQSNGLSA